MADSSGYAAFLERKRQNDADQGFEPLALHEFLFDFQQVLVAWALRKGKAAIFADCVAAGTLVNTEHGPIPIERMAEPTRVWSRKVDGEAVLTDASPSWINGYAPLYEYVTAAGRRLRATAGHRFLTDRGWQRGEDLAVGARLLGCDAFPPRSSSERDPSVPHVDGPHCKRTVVGSTDRYSVDPRACDGGQPLSVGGIGRAPLPLQVDARGRIPRPWRADDPVDRAARSHPRLVVGRRAMPDCARPVASVAVGAEYQPHASDLACTGGSIHTSLLAGEGSSLGRRGYEPHPSVSERCEDGQCEPCFSFDTLVAVHYIGEGAFYDLWVPETSAYVAGGLVSHNCGLGKTPMQLSWAENVILKTQRSVLIVTPLAVGAQTCKEGEKFGIECAQSRDGKPRPYITVTNYERLHHFNPDDFGGVVCDESSAIKSFDGVRRAIVTEFLRRMPYRLLCTATAAPNDYAELGTSSEALGYLGYMDMISRFFTNKDRTSRAIGGKWRSNGAEEWRFKGYAEDAFWRWVASWARAMRKPSDLGFDDTRFQLPPLEVRERVITARAPRKDMLFDLPAVGLREEGDESRRTIAERCEQAAALLADADSAVAWCQRNAEGDLLTKLIDGAVQVSGSDSPDAKEEALLAFSAGQIRVLVTKPKIGAFGLNWAHCHRMTYFPSHSYEQMYQAVRRCWRFGQTQPVVVDMITTEGGINVLKNMRRKSEAADRMFDELTRHMKDALSIDRSEHYTEAVAIPTWLGARLRISFALERTPNAHL